MDIVLPTGMTGALETAARNRSRRTARYRVLADGRTHTVMELAADGIVIEADGRPPLRGYAELFRGEERVMQCLVVCTWARDGLVGYEFKRDNSGCEVSPDHVPPAHAGLLPAP